MSQNQLVDLSKSFAADIIDICEEMKKRGKATTLISQLLRSGTSIGANIHEANYASGRSDFIYKLQIALKECYETEYWTDVFHQAKMLDESEYSNLCLHCNKLRRILIASINTAKKRRAEEKE